MFCCRVWRNCNMRRFVRRNVASRSFLACNLINHHKHTKSFTTQMQHTPSTHSAPEFVHLLCLFSRPSPRKTKQRIFVSRLIENSRHHNTSQRAHVYLSLSLSLSKLSLLLFPIHISIQYSNIYYINISKKNNEPLPARPPPHPKKKIHFIFVLSC